MDRDQVIATLREHEPELKAAGILRLSLFGSTGARVESALARGDHGPDSDIDLLASFDDTRRISLGARVESALLDVVGMEIGLSEILGCKVDLIEEGTLKPRVQKSVKSESLGAKVESALRAF
jgi:uncharacterized protein